MHPDYAAFAQELYDGCIISDPWIEGKERFRLEPVVLEPELYGRLCLAAESKPVPISLICILK